MIYLLVCDFECIKATDSKILMLMSEFLWTWKLHDATMELAKDEKTNVDGYCSLCTEACRIYISFLVYFDF